MPLDLLVAVDRPFPGLRPFEADQSLLFFGREQHTEELLRRLSANRFLAVVGTSGSGKSSLVRAGLLPALYRGHLVGATTHWRIAVMKPGDTPIENLCAALSGKDALGPAGNRLETLRSSSLGLVEVVQQANLPPGESLLIVADQFEELFRYASRDQAGDDDAALFVSLLLQAAERFDAPVYVVLTMRSDFLGDCAQFTGLPEALSHSQYLIPRLTREQRQQAIERPLQLAGVSITPSLVQQLLNDSTDDARALGNVALARGGRPDPLPVLQHALMKTFEEWKGKGGTGDLALPHYQLAGGVEKAIDQHAESIYSKKLDAAQQAWAQKIFRCLTTTESGRQTRRPTKLADLYAIIGAATEAQQREVDTVLELFLNRDDGLLVSSQQRVIDIPHESLNRDDGLLVSSQQRVIDIPHESLIWKWERLRQWVGAEAESAAWYVDLVNDVESAAKGKSGLWRDPDLGGVLTLARTAGWNQAWAAQYAPPAKPSFAETQAFLKRSQAQQTRERWTWRVAIAAIVLALAASAYYWRQGQAAEAKRQEAETQNQILLDQVKGLTNEQRKAKLEAKAANDEKQRLEAIAKNGTPEQKAQLEKATKEADEKQKRADRLQTELDQAAKAAAAGGDLKAVNQALQTTVDRLTSTGKTLEKDLSDERSRNKTLQESLNTANAEIRSLKSENEALKKQPQPGPANIVVPPPTAACSGRTNPVDGLCYVRIPAGKFRMGCSPGDRECSDDEKSVDVQITKSFYLGETEVTKAAYQRVMKAADPSHFKGLQRPVEQVSSEDAKNYCATIGGRLPTEAEWEYAVRAGNAAVRYGDLDQIAWYDKNSERSTHDVRGKLPNAWGLYDMLGNVGEWTADWYAPKLAGGPDPRGPARRTQRVLRGGSWFVNSRYSRASYRDRDRDGVAADRNFFIGFRCAWDSL